MKIFKFVLPIFFLLILFRPALAQEKNIYFFYGDGCPHCSNEEVFLEELKNDFPEIRIKSYEVWNNLDNARFLESVSRKLNLDISGVPVLIVGDKHFVGFHSAETTGKEIEESVRDYMERDCLDLVASMLDEGKGSECNHGCDKGDQECLHNCGCSVDHIQEEKALDKINIPLLGEIEIKDFSLLGLTAIIAFLDGFNPCAMWVLLFLISMLLGMKDRKKMWILGSTFIVTSGAVYFLFLSAWLSLFLFLGLVFWIRIIIALIALGSGAYHLKEYFTNKEAACKVTSGQKRQLIFEKIKNIIKTNKFWLAILGIILLAAAVNMVELVCSAGLPAIYTRVLTMSNLSIWQYYAYLLLYIVIFMIDDMFIFFIAMTTLRIKGISAKYSRFANLIGGIIMLIIGLLLIFKPGWLMFG